MTEWKFSLHSEALKVVLAARRSDQTLRQCPRSKSFTFKPLIGEVDFSAASLA